jgi:signal transduction histidine kinase
MELILVSRDSALLTLCREIIASLAGNHCAVSIADPDNVPSGAGFYIWDFDAGHSIPEHVAQHPGWKRLFLIPSRDRSALSRHRVLKDSTILLKPVNRGTLSAFLAQVSAAQETGGSLPSRGDCDEMLQCLIQANLKLQEYDQARTNFLARAVHDFRAPLTAVTGYCGLLLAEPLGALNDDQKEVLRRMRHSAARLARLAGGMLQLSVGNRVRTQLHLEKGDLRECFEQVIHEVTPVAEEKHIDICAEIEPSPEPIYFERNQMEQVLINLLENACKFTPRAGSIEIRGYPFFWDRRFLQNRLAATAAERRQQESQTPNSFRVDICDSGPGLPAGQLDSIFEEYTRYAGTQDRSGGGLGLAICRMILDNHRGRIWAESSDAGAMFSLVLPFWPAGVNLEIPERVSAGVA